MSRPDTKAIAYRIADQQLLPEYLEQTLAAISWWKERRQKYIDYPKIFPDYNRSIDSTLEYRQQKIKGITEIIEVLEQDARQMNRRLR